MQYLLEKLYNCFVLFDELNDSVELQLKGPQLNTIKIQWRCLLFNKTSSMFLELDK